MAISSDKKKLYVDATNNKGITPWEIAQCIGDYRITRLGRDIGMLCTSPKINIGAKYRPVPYDNLRIVTDEDRKAVGWGVDVIAEGYGNDDRMHYMRYSIYPLGAVGRKYRLLDFDGYNHAAKFGLGFTSTGATYPMFNNINNINLKANPDTGDNITFKELPDILAANFYYEFSVFNKFGIEVRCNTGCIVNTVEYDSYSALESALYRSAANYVNFSKMSEHPTGYGGSIYVYGSVTEDVPHEMKYALSTVIDIDDARTDDRGFWEVGRFNPNMAVGTFSPNGSKKVYEWQEGTAPIQIGSDDFFLFGFNITNKGTLDLACSNLRMRVIVDGTAYHLPVYRFNSFALDNYPAGDTVGPTGLDNTPEFYLSPADIKAIVPYAAGEKTVTFQVVNASFATGELLAILSSPIDLKIRYTGASVVDNDNYPDFEPIMTPDWKQELITD